MKIKKKILVFPCDSEIGLEIHSALKYSTFVELYGGSSGKGAHGKYVYKNFIPQIPFVHKKNFVQELKQIIKKNNIDFIFPAHDDVVLKLAQNEKVLDCKVLGSGKSTSTICRSKKKTYQHLNKIVRVPQMYETLKKNLPFPLFLKPEIGQGSKGVYIAKNYNELKFYLSLNPALLILEYLPGKEYTVDCFTNKEGKLLFVGPRERLRISNGISVNTKSIQDKRFIEIAEKINKSLQFRGVWFFQVKESKSKELVLLEVAPRVAGSMSLYRNLGVNLPLMTFFDALDIDTSLVYNNFDIELDRALSNKFKISINYNYVYIDCDDTLIQNNKVNAFFMTFLYQCVNKEKKLILITRHKKDINQTLKKYKLEGIFDEIIYLNDKDKKSFYIKHKDSIFIDDSFRERKDVIETCGISVFDLDAIESLIDWRL